MADSGPLLDFAAFDSSNDDAARPKYEQLRDHIAGEIRAGRLAPGTALPSEHRLAESLRFARSTIRQAMAALEREGLVRRVHGKGTFVHEAARVRARDGRNLFALIVPETQAGYYPSLQRSFEEAAARLHGQVIVCNSNNDIDRQGNAILQLIDNRVAGVAIVPTTTLPTPAFHLRQLQDREIPVVCCSRPVEGVSTPLLQIPFEEIGRRAGEAVAAAGHRRVTYIGTAGAKSSEAYERGFRAAFRAFSLGDLDIQSRDLATHGSDLGGREREQEISQVLDALWSNDSPPTAIFFSSDALAEIAHMLLIRRGLSVPKDISLVGFGGSRRHGALPRQLTSVTVDEIQLGREAIRLLDRMRHGETPIDSDESHDMPLGLSDGKTLAPRYPLNNHSAIPSSFPLAHDST